MSSSSDNARWGLILFTIYLFFYTLFICINTFAPSVIAHPFIGGVNIAIWAGLGLIALAFTLALIYLYHAKDDHEEKGDPK